MNYRILLILFGLLSFSCATPIVETFGNVSGVVRDESTNEPMEGVKVSITPTGASQVTDKEGHFLFDNLDIQEYTLTFTLAGYESVSQKVSVKPGLSTSVQVVMSKVANSLLIQPEMLDFGKTETNIRMTLESITGEALRWTASSSDNWISLSKKSGTVTGKDYVTATVSRSGLADGEYDGSIEFDAEGEKVVIPVIMSKEPDYLIITPESLDFGNSETSITMTLKCPSGTSVSWTATTSNSWLGLSKDSGTVTGTDHVTATVTRSGLSGGDYDGSIEFNVDGAKNVIPVSMSVDFNDKPLITADACSDITSSSVVLRGTITSVGSSEVTSHGFCWSTHNLPTVDDNSVNLGDARDAKSFECVATSLSSETTYYFRAYATNGSGISYSENQLEATTRKMPEVPVVSTGTVDNVKHDTALAEGTIISTGNADITSYGHVWNISPDPTLGSGDSSDLGGTQSPGEFRSELTGLSPNTTYYVRAYAQNEAGVSYGENVTFVTSKDEALNPANGLYAYYTFEDSNKNIVSGAPNVVMVGGPEYASGVAGTKAVQLSPSSYFTIPEPMIDKENFTVSFWAKGLSDGNIFYLDSGSKYGKSHILAMRDGLLTFIPGGYDLWFRYYDVAYGQTPSFMHSTLNSSEWHMITITSNYNMITYDVKLYIDGELVDNQKFNNASYSYNNGIKFIFGGPLSESGYSVSLNGISMTIDNLRIYNTRRLSSQEIANLYNYEK